jgi:predicted dehydrogenase
VDDASIFVARFKSGALGTFEATRFAGGNRNANKFEINGEKDSIKWNAENLNELEIYFASDENGLQGFRKITCTEEIHPYAGAYWPAGHIIGYEHTFINLITELMKGIEKGTNTSPTFIDGYINQAIMQAVEKSSKNKTWEIIDNFVDPIITEHQLIV